MMQNGQNANALAASASLRFGTYELDTRTGELRRAGVLIHLQPQPTKLLEMLARRPGELVTREEIQRELWNGETHVDFERSINICVMQIRAALGDDAETPRFVETLPRRGYRFVAEVQSGAQVSAAPASFASSPAQNRRAWVSATIVALALFAAALFWKLSPVVPSVPTPGTGRVMLAVLPFENLSGKDELAYVADGMTEELIAQLGSIAPEKLGVIARTSAMRYRGAKESVTKIGDELKVAYVIEGSVRLENKRSWVTAQLIRVSDQTHLWADTYEMDGVSVFTQQRMAALLVVQNVASHLVPKSESVAAGQREGTSSPAAMEAYLQGRYLFYKGGSDNVADAVQHLERAVAADPKFADAQAALADTLQFGAMIGRFTVAEAAPRAQTAAARALEAEPASSEAQAARGLAALWFEWNPQLAGAHFQKAIAANPSNSEAHHDYAWTLVTLGRDDEAVREIQAAQALDPVSPRANMDLGWIYLGVRRYADAIRHCTRMVEIEPRVYEAAQSCLETANLRTGNAAAAAAAALRQFERNSDLADRVAAWKKLQPEQALREVRSFRLNQRMTGPTKRKAYRAAELHLQLGQKEEALRFLEQAFAEREMLLVSLHRSPEFDTLRDTPRFQALLAKIKARSS